MALLIDYIVTVAVQVAAGTAAIASVFPVVGTYKVEISAGIILLMCYGNLRGLKEAGRAFAVPTYLFAGSVILMIIVGLIREVAGHLTPYDPRTLTNHYAIGAGDSALISGVMIFTLLRAFANGGASLTGIEAVSTRSARSGRRRAATPARSWWLRVHPGHPGGGHLLARAHDPRDAADDRVPDRAGPGGPADLRAHLDRAGHVRAGPGGHRDDPLHRGNTSFNGFPFLTSYVAGDSFLPRWLLARHRWCSPGILLLTVASVALLIIEADVTTWPLYAIGVFTAFTWRASAWPVTTCAADPAGGARLNFSAASSPSWWWPSLRS